VVDGSGIVRSLKRRSDLDVEREARFFRLVIFIIELVELILRRGAGVVK